VIAKAGDSEHDAWLKQLDSAAHSSELSRPKALVLSVTLGFLGVDRFYLGHGIAGLLKLGTLGGFGVWWAIDVVLIAAGFLRDAEGGRLKSSW